MNQQKVNIIASTYGIDNQLRQLQEECGELIVAVNKLFRNKDHKALDSMFEELADVKIMIAQIEFLTCSENSVDEHVNAKLDRQLERLYHEEADRMVKM